MKLVNVGCGSTFHRDWINFDLVARSPHIINTDITRGLPLEDGSVDVCYSSHVLEHLRREEGDQFIREQKRVLKKGGTIRVVVPDLEVICRNYLLYLEQLTAGDRSNEFRYDYTLLELYDQTTRDVSGGDLGKMWRSGDIPDTAFVINRHGKEAENAINYYRNLAAGGGGEATRSSLRRTLTGLGDLGRHFRNGRRSLAELLVAGLLGRNGVRELREGEFRNSGEIHRVMYDRFSLVRLLASNGFEEMKVCRADESRIPGFISYGLDVVEGKTRKPDSLFVEAVRA